MFKAIISAALVLSPLAFADEPAPMPTEPAAPAKEAPKKGKHHRGDHHGHKPAPAGEEAK